jgi:hypothetical protein
LWSDEFAFLNKTGQADLQTDLFYDYRTCSAHQWALAAINDAYASTKTAAEARAYAASLKFTPELRAMMGDMSGGAAHLCRGATLPRRT